MRSERRVTAVAMVPAQELRRENDKFRILITVGIGSMSEPRERVRNVSCSSASLLYVD